MMVLAIHFVLVVTRLNDNFVELYTLLGTGSALTLNLSATASVVTLTNFDVIVHKFRFKWF